MFPTEADASDPTEYGRSFADVYDEWYADGSETSAIAFMQHLAGPSGSVFELGIGTGRIALPLAAAGLTVSGIDASADMLSALASKPGGPGLVTVMGDAGDPDAYPPDQFDVVVAAFNLLFNLTSPGAQQRCLDSVARLLAPDGVLVLEAFVPRQLEVRERDLVTRSVHPDHVVLIATDADPSSGLVQGNHIELRDGSVRLRPWSIRVALPSQIDAMALQAGLELVDRFEDYHRNPYLDGHSTHHVSIYRCATVNSAGTGARINDI